MISGHLASKTWLHAVPARLKLCALAAATFIAFWMENAYVLSGAFAIVLGAYLVMGPEARSRLRIFSSMLPILLVITIFQYWSVGPDSAAVIVLRLALMILLADMVSMTTPMLDMMDAVQPLMRPFAIFGLEPEKLTLAIALVLRFVPALLEEWRRRNEAWRARTGRRASLRLLAPFIGSIVTKADRVAEALDARGFDRRRK
ncbi:MAG: energy-coupling factor transporter transmembrane protein EcfT [Beijerinckiaceae bacterium]|nr:energy-coupling factor transporter transmembrane protein EcfT [Beijerinckiaceae bacterium]